MKYIKLFEEHASVYRKKYDEVEKEIQSSIYDDINNIFDRLNVEILKTEPKTYGVPTINGDYYLRDLIKDGSKITYRAMKPDDGNELEEHIYDMSTSDLISVYEYFENITLGELIRYVHKDESAYDMGLMYKANYDKIDLENMTDEGDSFFDLYERNKSGINNGDEDDMVNNYHFQKWIIEKHPEKIGWMKEQDIIWCEEIEKEYPDIKEGDSMGFFDLKNK